MAICSSAISSDKVKANVVPERKKLALRIRKCEAC